MTQPATAQFTTMITDAHGRSHRLSLKTEPLADGHVRVSAIKRIARTDVHLGRFLFEKAKDGSTVAVRPVSSPQVSVTQYPAAWMLGVLGLIPTQQSVAEMLMAHEQVIHHPPESVDTTIHPATPDMHCDMEQDDLTQMLEREAIIERENEEALFLHLQEETGFDTWDEINEYLAEEEISRSQPDSAGLSEMDYADHDDPFDPTSHHT